MSRPGRRGAQIMIPREVKEGEVETIENGEEIVPEESGGQEPTLADLTSLFRAQMAQIDAREARRAQEQKEQERRFKALQHQFGLLQMEVQARIPTPPTPGPCSMNPSPEAGQDGDPDLDRPFSGRRGRLLHHVDQDRGQSWIKEPRMEKLSDSDDRTFSDNL